MQEFALVLASVFKKSLNTLALTKQKLPQYEVEKNPTY